MKMIKNEFKFIFSNKIILISLFAIMFIPFLYSIFFLKSVWDPYGSTGDLPVAVVNEDRPVTYQGQKMHAGDDMVKELKHNKQIGWKFVSADTAKQGLKNKKYYTIVTLPKDFSKNAATVLDKNPKKMQIKYKTNDSLNYIAEVISETGAKELNSQVREAVTTAYAKVMFSQVKEAGKGFKDAARGAKQLSDGSNKLSDGLNVYTSGIDQVNDGVLTMQTSVVPLSNGVSQLASGSSQLATGVGAYTNGVGTLNNGLQTLASKNGQLQSGASSLSTGVEQLKNGSSQIDAGLKQMQSKINNNPSFSSDQNYKNAVDGYKGLQTKITEIQSQLQNLDQVLQPIIDQVEAQDYSAKAQEIIDAEKKLGVTFDQFQEKALKVALTQKLKEGAVDEATQIVNGVKTQVSGKISNEEFAQLQAATQGSIDMLQSLREIQTGLNSKLVPGMDQLDSGISQLQSGSTTIAEGLSQYTNGVATAANGASQLNANSGALNSGANQLSAGTGELNAKIPVLSSGVNQLANGTKQLAANSPQLTNGVAQLSDGNNTLATALKDGSKKVNSIKLTDKTANQFAAPSELKHSNYSKVPNYGHALAPYVLSLALYVGALVFNFAFPIRKISMTGQSSTAWFLSKISVGGIVAIAMAIIEPALMMAAGLQVDNPGQFFAVAISFSIASMAIVMFLSMTFDNPGRFLAMILLMLQLGGSGGTFPMEVTNGFYNFIHPLLPMSYSNLGFRQAITSGLGSGQITQTVSVLALFTIINLALLWTGMYYLQKRGNNGESVLDDNQKLQEVEK
ncbi:YhgE/Pip family protein [Companilactobacillus sp. DQM5]|uniref:YhgE/Pip family protein n=1 Tax=Companilactobacillus sp. DQM5 TaxID=3463359 RepID=UPI004057CD7D